jgi:hypothetical protein
MPRAGSSIAAASATLVAAGVAFAAPSVAAPPGPTAELICPSATYTVVGFGRGEPLHVVGSTSRFIVTRAVANGEVIIDNPARADRPLETCTTVSPISGTNYTFTGFFTPVR